jgi:hypothetical protein
MQPRVDRTPELTNTSCIFARVSRCHTRAFSAALALCVSLVATAEAGPDEAARLRSEGDAFARARRYEEAVAAFKKAEREEPRADHDCFIALAYRRLERWGQAEMFHARCRERVAAAGGAEPPWSAQVAEEIRAGLAKSGYARVSIAVEPAGATGALVTVSSFAPDESFAPPRTIWLPPGKHLVEATAPDRPGGQLTVAVEVGSEQSVVVPLEPGAAPATTGDTTPPPAPATGEVDVTTPAPPAPAQQRSALTWISLGAGAAAIVVGVTFHVLALRNQDRLRDAVTDAEYRDHETAFDVERAGTYIAYGVGATALAFGAYLYFTGASREEPPPVRVGAAADGDGGAVFLEWQR